MNRDSAIICDRLTKRYLLFGNDLGRLKCLLMPRFKAPEYTALHNISLEVRKGEIVGLIGLNGSGKSTLASIIAGISYPTQGSITVRGEVSMLSTATGMEPLLTGRENIRYKCLLLGFDSRFIREREEAIIEFADLGIYIDQPFRTYSSGMKARLGFAISVHLEPDILLIDEALSVGDSGFAEKCAKKMEEIRVSGRTILFVTHAVAQLKSFCDRVIWLHMGELIAVGKPCDLIDPYYRFAKEFQSLKPEERAKFRLNLERYRA